MELLPVHHGDAVTTFTLVLNYIREDDSNSQGFTFGLKGTELGATSM